MRRKMSVDWSVKACERDFSSAIARYYRYLRDLGLRSSTIESYAIRLKCFLEYTKSDRPTTNSFEEYRANLIEKNLSRSSINNTCFAIKHYYKMNGEEISFPFIRPDNHLPYYFDENDVLGVFSVCNNIKHLAMLKILFYASLRASELCNLDDNDVDLKSLMVRVRGGKGGKDGIAYISDECATTLKKYLEMRSSLEIAGLQPLFYTDFGNRWDRRDVNRMFHYYKKKAGIEKAGGVHVFARHTAATILVANGCDLRHVKELLRHNDIRTTLRYAHVGEKTLREKYNKCLTLG